MSADHHLAMSTAMFQAKAAAHAALCHAEETEDGLVQDVREGREEAVVVERDSLEMVDRRRLKKSLMPRWKTIGEQRRMVQRMRRV